MGLLITLYAYGFLEDYQASQNDQNSNLYQSQAQDNLANSQQILNNASAILHNVSITLNQANSLFNGVPSYGYVACFSDQNNNTNMISYINLVINNESVPMLGKCQVFVKQNSFITLESFNMQTGKFYITAGFPILANQTQEVLGYQQANIVWSTEIA